MSTPWRKLWDTEGWNRNTGGELLTAYQNDECKTETLEVMLWKIEAETDMEV